MKFDIAKMEFARNTRKQKKHCIAIYRVTNRIKKSIVKRPQLLDKNKTEYKNNNLSVDLYNPFVSVQTFKKI